MILCARGGTGELPLLVALDGRALDRKRVCKVAADTKDLAVLVDRKIGERRIAACADAHALDVADFFKRERRFGRIEFIDGGGGSRP